jgi:hypothetical protein
MKWDNRDTATATTTATTWGNYDDGGKSLQFPQVLVVAVA